MCIRDSYWINELWRLGYMLFGLGAIGLLLGELGGELFAGLGWGLAAGLGLYVFLHLCHVRMLYVWLLKNPREAPPPGTGVWGDLFDRLYNYQKAQTQLQQRLRECDEAGDDEPCRVSEAREGFRRQEREREGVVRGVRSDDMGRKGGEEEEDRPLALFTAGCVPGLVS